MDLLKTFHYAYAILKWIKIVSKIDFIETRMHFLLRVHVYNANQSFLNNVFIFGYQILKYNINI